MTVEPNLCVGCLERRIGRRLTPLDFTEFPINWPSKWDTPRLAARKLSIAPPLGLTPSRCTPEAAPYEAPTSPR